MTAMRNLYLPVSWWKLMNHHSKHATFFIQS